MHAHTRIRGALRSDRRIVTLSLRRGCGSTTEKSTWANSSLCVFKLFDINISLLSNLALRFSARMMSSLRLLLAGAGCSPDKLRRLDLPESIIYQISGCHVTIRGYLLSRIYETGRYMRRWHLILVLSYMVCGFQGYASTQHLFSVFQRRGGWRRTRQASFPFFQICAANGVILNPRGSGTEMLSYSIQ